MFRITGVAKWQSFTKLQSVTLNNWNGFALLAFKHDVPPYQSSIHQLFTHPANQFWHTGASCRFLSTWTWLFPHVLHSITAFNPCKALVTYHSLLCDISIPYGVTKIALSGLVWCQWYSASLDIFTCDISVVLALFACKKIITVDSV